MWMKICCHLVNSDHAASRFQACTLLLSPIMIYVRGIATLAI